MRSTKTIPIGEFESLVLGDKWLIRADSNFDYAKNDPSGLVLLDKNQRRVAKVLDVLGNVSKPYLLAEPMASIPSGKIFLEIPQRKHSRKNRR
ncbi:MULTISPECIES: Gar1/Naf1 family protein [Metallosphaera]|uniref:H/ACA RNA-protein complex protein Gar1 n=3 Tax=Metallosphaera TaxID=41980 RepID=A4YHI5_METS5|nr:MULTISPECIES: Gar1/Naf1 family protein [Metallosphaera]ABP95887.1 hypothetical protein Msed_1732 [Metallosphaera sedula DSM 5348]AIM27871.1 hypothetical protein HA72_1732 [Metallosphaera sedula]AKV74711.1 H/ACA RNA-protein complex protein Gar1 [Metallosphaera sedula]AKV76949.1 H/ACA RNA-protein complex protein Gar1 [Metallosphaera sedula]AKV79200.1 H/ACA RNA-protein complex protein Gar1 [Metallosphaera sedula]